VDRPPAERGTGRLRPKQTPWLAIVVGAALAALIWMVAEKRAENRRPPRPTARARAALLRDGAMKSCAERRWSDCETWLDAARRLDPTGEGEARVIDARRAIDEAAPADARAR
jgi:hypothetical protein